MKPQPEKKTAIVVCKSCGLRTRHEWGEWEHRPLSSLLTGQSVKAQGWICTRCGRRRITG